MAGLDFRLPKLNPIGPKSGITMSDLPEQLSISDPSGPLGDSSGLLDMAGDIGKGIEQGLSAQDELNQKFMQRNQNIARNIKGFGQASDVASGIASKLGPIGAIVGGGLKIGSALNKSSTDEFGVIKDPVKQALSTVLNPITGISTLLGQKERQEKKTAFAKTEIQSKKAENQVAGNKITNSIPQYTPPSYGRFGRKLTKFTK